MVEKPPADWRAARMRRTGARRTGTRRTGTKARRKQKGSQAKPRSTQTKATVFLGGGRITGALIAGLRLAGYDGRIVVHDHNPGKLRALRREYRIEAAGDLKSAVAQADVLIVAVRPLAVADLLNEVARSGIIRKSILAISLAAGIPIKKLRARLGRPVQWTRAMPSPVCRIGRGLTAVTFDRQVPKPSRNEFVNSSRGLGRCWNFLKTASTFSPRPSRPATAITQWRRWPKRRRTPASAAGRPSLPPRMLSRTAFFIGARVAKIWTPF